MITEKEYWQEVRSLAISILDDAWEQHPSEDDQREREEFMSDRLHEDVDGHQWIIYTHYNVQVLHCAHNPEAYWDQMGEAPQAENYGQLMAVLAYSALQEDVAQVVGDLNGEREAKASSPA